MGFGDTLKRIATGVSTGGLSEVARGMSGGGGLFDFLAPSKQTATQVPLETEEQRRARQELLKFALSGNFGGFTAGQDLNLPMGDFSPTDIEQGGLSSLRSLISSTLPKELDLAGAGLQDLLATSPEAIEAQFNPFKTQTERLLRESEDAVKRSSGFAGNLYSTDTIGRLGDVRARGNELLTQRLAELTNEALNRRLQAIPQALNLATMREQLPLQRVAASQSYGSLDRLLNTARQEAERNEALRRRTELQQPIGALQAIINSPVTFGIPSVTTTTPSPYMDLLQTILGGVGQGFGQRLGRGAVA